MRVEPMNHRLISRQSSLIRHGILTVASISLLAGGLGVPETLAAPIAQLPQDDVTVPASPNSARRYRKLPSAIARSIVQDAAQRTGIPIQRWRIVQVTSRTFSNPCEFNFGEVCTRDYRPIPGWEVIVQAQKQSLTYHVDQTGAQLVTNAAKPTTSNSLPATLRNAILQRASQQSGLPATSLQISRATAKTFGNACEFNFGEICTKEYNPIEGWEVIVPVRGQTWIYHVDRSGNRIVRDPKIGTSSNTNLPNNVQMAILRDATAWARVATNDIRIVTAEPQTWSNSCVFSFGNVCPTIYQPIQGWQVQVSAGLLQWVYRTNQNGTAVVMDQRNTLPPNVANAIAQEAARRSGTVTNPTSLRFLQVKTDTRRVCRFIFNCRNEPAWLAVISNGQQQWGYESDEQGREIRPVPVARVVQLESTTVSDQRVNPLLLD